MAKYNEILTISVASTRVPTNFNRTCTSFCITCHHTCVNGYCFSIQQKKNPFNAYLIFRRITRWVAISIKSHIRRDKLQMKKHQSVKFTNKEKRSINIHGWIQKLVRVQHQQKSPSTLTWRVRNYSFLVQCILSSFLFLPYSPL